MLNKEYDPIYHPKGIGRGGGERDLNCGERFNLIRYSLLSIL